MPGTYETWGVDAVLGELSDWGVDALSMASSYHSGFFIHPHNPRHKMYLAEDGVVYFQPQGRFFDSTPLKPQVAAVSAETDWFAAAGERLDRHGLKLMAWTVCTHNTRLGMSHPECVVRNAFGDPYHDALCPSNDAVRHYIRGLCRNLADSYPVHAIQLEVPGFELGVPHGHHHERWGTVLRPLEAWLMSLCFCESCRDRFNERGLDADAIASGVRDHMAAFFDHAPLGPPGRPASRDEMLQALPQLAEVEETRRTVETSLIQEISGDVRALGDTHVHAFKGYDPDWAPHVDAFSVQVYHKRPDEAARLVREQRDRMGEDGHLHVPIRVGFDAIMGPGELGDVVEAVDEAGGSSVGFYNYSEAPKQALRWIKPALKRVNGN